mgnify:CR=1 FL=1
MLNFCGVFNIITKEKNRYKISEKFLNIIGNNELINKFIVQDIINILFDNNVLNIEMFQYNLIKNQIIFRNELLHLHFSGVRNYLTTTDFFEIERNNSITTFYINNKYGNFIKKKIKNTKKIFSLKQLKQQMEENEIAGEKAEIFVLNYEKKRIGFPLAEKIQRISDFYVNAGYDIASYNDITSIEHDRFIEVKAISNNNQFYWSRNEYEKAKILGNRYFLYLIDLSSVEKKDYVPLIIQNPSYSIINSDEYIVETENYKITKLSYFK